MSLRLLIVLVFALTPLAARAADDEHPFKNAKVGDFAKYDTRIKTATLDVKLVRVQTVTAVGDNTVSLRTVSEINGKETPNKKGDQKIDLTKPFDPAGESSPTGAAIKWEKLKEGKQKVKIGGKEYDCTWTSYKPVAAAKPDAPVEGELRVWMSKEVPFVVKRALQVKIGAEEIVYTTDLIEFGTKK
jgi:hypothetical protein